MESSLSISELLEELDNFATVVCTLLSASDVGWSWRPDPASWSLVEVMCHLRDVEEEVHAVRYRSVINQDNPFLAGATTDEWAVIRCYGEQDGEKARDAFLTARRQNLALLKDLDNVIWQRMGRHAFFGPTSLQELVQVAVQHDAVHLQQIQELLHK